MRDARWLSERCSQNKKKWQNQQDEFKRDGGHPHRLTTIELLGEPAIFFSPGKTNHAILAFLYFYFPGKREVFEANTVQRTKGCVSDALTLSFTVILFLNFSHKRPRRTHWALQQCRSNSVAMRSRGLAVKCLFSSWTCFILNSIWQIRALGWGFGSTAWIFKMMVFVKWVLESLHFSLNPFLSAPRGGE